MNYKLVVMLAGEKRPTRCVVRNGGVKLEGRCERYKDAGEENARVDAEEG